ncbi:hypothetical protein EJB05_14654, partial [Eragrostis curvula]
MAFPLLRRLSTAPSARARLVAVLSGAPAGRPAFAGAALVPTSASKGSGFSFRDAAAAAVGLSGVEGRRTTRGDLGVFGDGAAGVEDGDTSGGKAFAGDAPASTAPRALGVRGCLSVAHSYATPMRLVGRGYAKGHGDEGAVGLHAGAGRVDLSPVLLDHQVLHRSTAAGALIQAGKRRQYSATPDASSGDEAEKRGSSAGGEARKEGRGVGQEEGMKEGPGDGGDQTGKQDPGEEAKRGLGKDPVAAGRDGDASIDGAGRMGPLLPRRRGYRRNLQGMLNHLQRSVDYLANFIFEQRVELQVNAAKLQKQVSYLPLKFFLALALGVLFMAQVVLEIILPNVLVVVHDEFLRLAKEIIAATNEADEEKLKRMAGHMAKVVTETVMPYFGSHIMKEIISFLKFWEKK